MRRVCAKQIAERIPTDRLGIPQGYAPCFRTSCEAEQDAGRKVSTDTRGAVSSNLTCVPLANSHRLVSLRAYGAALLCPSPVRRRAEIDHHGAWVDMAPMCSPHLARHLRLTKRKQKRPFGRRAEWSQPGNN